MDRVTPSAQEFSEVVPSGCRVGDLTAQVEQGRRDSVPFQQVVLLSEGDGLAGSPFAKHHHDWDVPQFVQRHRVWQV